jgi:HD-like signal output (HDOD) protein
MTMDRSGILKKIASEVSHGDVSFPTSVQVALKLQRALDDPECHVEDASKLIVAEPLLSSKVVAMANSVVYNPAGREITDVRTAVARLGFRTIRTLATGIVARQLAGKQSASEDALSAQLWEHTAHVAALARVIARKVTHQDPETAMFAGIVHEVGGFYLISRAKDYPGLLDEGFSEWSDTGEADVGHAVLAVLGIPDTVIAAIDVCWQGYLAMPPVTLGDTLLLADELAPVMCPLRMLAKNQRADMGASIDMVIGQDTLSEILAESAEEVASLIAALRI